MKKLAFVVPLLLIAVTVTSCRLFINYEGIEQFFEDLESGYMRFQPEDNGVSIILEGLPPEEEFPAGLNGISIYVVTEDPTDKPASELGDPVKSGIVENDSFFVPDLDNGTQYFFEARGEIVGDTATTYGYSGGFYPRPWGYGDYLGYDPGQDPDSSQGPDFDTTTGEPTTVNEGDNPDFYFSMDTGVLYVHGAVHKHDNDADEWLDVQGYDGTYEESAEVHEGGIYHFMTADGYYGKFKVDQLENIPAAILAGESIKTYLTYAFQTSNGVRKY